MRKPDVALPNYYKILEKKKKPKFKLINLEPKIKKAFKILESCELCERKCRVNRLKGEKGFCNVTDKMVISSYFDHYGEEFFFVPSFTIFFWSCTFSCQFCQNWDISQRYEPGIEISEEKLAEIIDEHSYCKNVNFVGGDPVPQLPFILKTLKFVKSNLPVVWNSNFYMSEKSMQLLKGVVDVYLSDWKYWSNDCAKRLSKVDNYLEIVKRNHELAFKDAELVIRHLVLPNHFKCCTKPIFEFIAKNFKEKAVVNVMSQYSPQYLADKYKEINRRVTVEEMNNAIEYAKRLSLNFIT